MVSKLTQLLEEIAPEKTIYLCESRAGDSVRSFKGSLENIDNIHVFLEQWGRFYIHVQDALLGIPSSTTYNPKLHDGMASDVLKEIYGRNGWMTPFEMMKSGYGMTGYNILKTFALSLARKEAENWISIKVYGFWNRLNNQEKLEVCNEYIENYSYLYPRNFVQHGEQHLYLNMPQVLKMHPFLISGLPDYIDKYVSR